MFNISVYCYRTGSLIFLFIVTEMEGFYFCLLLQNGKVNISVYCYRTGRLIFLFILQNWKFNISVYCYRSGRLVFLFIVTVLEG